MKTGEMMKARTKWFIGGLLASVVVASIVSGQPQILAQVAILFAAIWIVWRGYVFLALLLSPVREKLRPYIDPVNQHVDSTLRRSGLSVVANVSDKIQAGIDGAVSATQKGIDERNK